MTQTSNNLDRKGNKSIGTEERFWYYKPYCYKTIAVSVNQFKHGLDKFRGRQLHSNKYVSYEKPTLPGGPFAPPIWISTLHIGVKTNQGR